MKQKYEETLALAVRSVSAAIKYSKSGAHYKIQRPELGPYEANDSALRELWEISEAMKYHFFDKALNRMIAEKAADCFEQSLLLALILKCIPEINAAYQINIASVYDARDEIPKAHSFLALIPRSCTHDFPNPLDAVSTKIEGSVLLDNRILILDPWQNRIYHPMTTEDHVLAGLSSPEPETLPITLQNMDMVFLDLQDWSKKYPNSKQSALNFIKNTIKACDLLMQPLRDEQTFVSTYQKIENALHKAQTSISERLASSKIVMFFKNIFHKRAAQLSSLRGNNVTSQPEEVVDSEPTKETIIKNASIEPKSRQAKALELTTEYLATKNKQHLVQSIHTYGYARSSDIFGLFKCSKNKTKLQANFEETYKAANPQSRTGLIRSALELEEDTVDKSIKNRF